MITQSVGLEIIFIPSSCIISVFIADISVFFKLFKGNTEVFSAWGYVLIINHMNNLKQKNHSRLALFSSLHMQPGMSLSTILLFFYTRSKGRMHNKISGTTSRIISKF